jgi:Family of unknown function (DUF6064)
MIIAKIPFATEQFIQVFEKYNQAIYPFQFALILVAIIVPIGFCTGRGYANANATVFIAASRKPFASKHISSLLGFLWLWAGIVYHLVFFTAISPPAYLFGTLFIVQGLLFLYEGVVMNRLSFQASQNLYSIFGAIFITYALVIYPLIGYALGRTFLASPTFGTPCPTVIFTFGLLLWTDKRFPLSLLIIPVLWSLVGTSAALSFGIKEDLRLFVAGTIGTIMIIRHNLSPKMKKVL